MVTTNRRRTRRICPALLVVLLAACAGGGSPSSGPPAPTPPAAPTPAAADPAADPTPPTLRLPAGVRPTSYDLALAVDPERRDFAGEITIHLGVAAPTRFFWLHAQDLAITSARARQGGRDEAVRTVVAEGGFLGVALTAPLAAGDATLTLAFTGRLDDERSRGIYRVKEPDGHQYAYTFFEATDARRAFPCFDEPGFKVPWRVTLTAPKGAVAVANTPVRRADVAADGATTTSFVETPPLPSYLVAFVVGPFELVDGGTIGAARLPLRFIVPTGRASELAYALEITPRAVAALETWFGIPYPFAKLDVAVVPRFWGTMEHPGIVAMGQPLTLMKPHEATLERKQAFANILIHELGHYWFGDLVTMAWWDETWLNEGLTTWVDQQATHAFEPTWLYDREAWYGRARAMGGDGQGAARALRKPVLTTTDIQSTFDGGTTYYKGAAIMDMLERWLGADVVRRGIRRFLHDHAWKNATSEDLFAALSAEAGRDVAPVLKSFVDQPGVPVVSMTLGCAKGAAPTLELGQERYRPIGQRFDAEAQLWTIPVCVRFGAGRGETTHCDLLEARRATWTLPTDRCPTWLVGNDGATGYYRTRYSAELLAAARARFARLPLAERMELARDVTSQVNAGHLDVEAALSLGVVAARDRELPVVLLGLRLLGYVNSDDLDDQARAAHRRLVGELVRPLAKRLGWRPRPGESVDELDARRAALSALLLTIEDPAAIREATRLVRAWLADRTTVDHDLAALLVFAAAHHGDAALFDAYLAEADRTPDREDRTLLLSALGSFPEPALLERALALVLDPARDLRDTVGILSSAMRKTHRARTWAFFKEHHPAILGRLRDDEKSDLLGLPSAFCRADMRPELEAFLTPIATTIDGGPNALASVLDGLDTCAALKARLAPGIARFLARY